MQTERLVRIKKYQSCLQNATLQFNINVLLSRDRLHHSFNSTKNTVSEDVVASMCHSATLISHSLSINGSKEHTKVKYTSTAIFFSKQAARRLQFLLCMLKVLKGYVKYDVITAHSLKKQVLNVLSLIIKTNAETNLDPTSNFCSVDTVFFNVTTC